MINTQNPEWRIEPGLLDYETGVAAMEERVALIRNGLAPELLWLVEHPPLYTAGTSAQVSDLLSADRFPVYKTGRGGQYTYHGPGQRVVYAMLDLRARGRDVRCYVHQLEDWIIRTLAEFGVQGERREGRVGVWVARGQAREDKIAALGVRIKGWVSFHGLAINVAPELEHYSGITPCGISQHGVTSLADLGIQASMADVDDALKRTFEQAFAPPACADINS